jgi:hypothetical protein
MKNNALSVDTGDWCSETKLSLLPFLNRGEYSISVNTGDIRHRPSRVIENYSCYIVRRRLSLSSSFVLNVKNCFM